MGYRLCNSVHRHQQKISDYLTSTVCQVYRAPTYSDELMTSSNDIVRTDHGFYKQWVSTYQDYN